MLRVNVCLVHPPSIYDFRNKNLRSGPISDVIPSTPLFEMYPVGFISMLNSLVSAGYNARISNVAVQMLYSSRFDVRKYLAGIEADIFGIDLHWLPHVHGAISIAKILRELHPDSKILFGGFSSTYFSEEIMKEHPEVDFVLRGDLQEDSIVQLAEAVERGADLSGIPNLAYRDGNTVKFNHINNDRDAIDRVFFNYDLLMRNSLKYGDIRGHLPYKAWLRNPTAMTLIEHGCQYNCGFCGGSNYTFKNHYFLKSPLFRDPDTVAEELLTIERRLGTPVFIAGDMNAAGKKFQEGFFRAVKERGIDIPLLTEYFVPAPESFFEDLKKVFPRFTAEISPESSDERIRGNCGRYYTNHDLEKSIEYARLNGCRKFDIYFTIGLPGQKREDVISDTLYSEKLMAKHLKENMPVHAFLSPITPFLDPGSMFYELRERYGITLKAKTLQDYYNLLDQGKSWEDYLNYETSEMNTEEIADITYRAGILMAEVRERLGVITRQERDLITANIEAYRNRGKVIAQEAMGMHLNYMVKEIEWSKRHHVTLSSFMIFLYSFYDSFRMKFDQI